MSLPAAPQHCPTPRELDDLELLTIGGLAPLTGFNQSRSPVTLDLPAQLVDQLDAGGRVELVDPEGLPLALLSGSADGWPVEPLTHTQFGPFRDHYLTPSQTREQYAGRTFVPVTDALTGTQLAELRELGPVVLLALVGAGTPALSPVGLLRAALRAVNGIEAAVVAVPLARHDDAAADAELQARVLATYAGGDPVVTLTPGGEVLPELADIVATERPPRHQQGLVLFFTGLSGSGKSTLARALMDRLLEQGGRSVTSLDGDVVRRNLSAGLTFSREDRETNIRRIGWVAAEISRHGGVAVCSPIAPFDATRQQVRRYVADAGGAFFLVHVATPLEECERRDRKGLYAKARRGEIPEFTGISSPYEEPADPDVRVDTTGRSIEAALDDVLAGLRDAGYLDLTGNLETESTDTAGGLDTRSPGGSEHATNDAGTSDTADGRDARPTDTAGGRAASVSERGEAPLRVLFVCTANICRSPYMELRARSLVGDDAGAEFASAGTHGFHQHHVDATMAAVLAEREVGDQLTRGFASRRLTPEVVEAADLVLTAEASHRDFLLSEAPAAFRKVFTLGQFAETIARLDGAVTARELIATANQRRAAASPATDIDDPFNRGSAAMRTAADHIDDYLRVVLPRLTARQEGDA